MCQQFGIVGSIRLKIKRDDLLSACGINLVDSVEQSQHIFRPNLGLSRIDDFTDVDFHRLKELLSVLTRRSAAAVIEPIDGFHREISKSFARC
jgi:hypothetical protein